MKITKQTYDEERAFYGTEGVILEECLFDGPADGESAFKECQKVTAERCFFDLRYPFWHDEGAEIVDCEMTANCRAALWYTHRLRVSGTKMHGIKALRECSDAVVSDCDIVSPEFGWFSHNIRFERCRAVSEYFLLRSSGILMKNCSFEGKYSFQYTSNVTIENCELNTKDAFWHADNVTVRNCTVNGEYLGWYSRGLTLIDCRITGTQPLCYCKNLRLINCEMYGADLCFENSDVDAVITTPLISIKNPRSGTRVVPSVDEIIDEYGTAKIIVNNG